MDAENWGETVISIKSDADFEKLALLAFRYQYQHIPVYKHYVDLLNIIPSEITSVAKIPFLPIEMFKTHQVIAKGKFGATIFTSSGTTGHTTSSHYVADLNLYKKSYMATFERFYGKPTDYIILALLPSYLERGDSSLVFMVRGLIEETRHPASGFYLYNYADLHSTLMQLKSVNRKILLIGVTFALLEFAEKFPMSLPNAIVMETGGMKGRRKELTRPELHNALKTALGCPNVHSEYGMTELLSQAYSKGNGIFEAPPWLKILIRDPYDPFEFMPNGRSGGINVVDLANLNSCCFIETQDLGKLKTDQTFEVLGRFDNSDIRGCNLLVQS